MNNYSFLEPIDSPEALEWAEKWSGETVDKLPKAPRTGLQRRLLEALDTDDRIPYVSRRGQTLFNFWRDATHPRGLWRTQHPSLVPQDQQHAPAWVVAHHHA